METISYEQGPEFRTEPSKAFDSAISCGHLSTDPASPRYAGDYMYMHSDSARGVDVFKNRESREYVEFKALF